MVNRLINPSKTNSYFLFGARGTGKSTLLKTRFQESKKNLYIDLLNLSVEDRYRSDSELLQRELKQNDSVEWVIIDEIQKVPRLLDVVHQLIESTSIKFALSCSSARKLKRGGANLLAGRAFVYTLYPFTSVELGKEFDLSTALEWGLLPKIYSYKNDNDRLEYLLSYALMYLREEIQLEQIIRKLEPFRLFLQIAAQSHGKIVNYSRVAKQCGVDTTTVQNYYSILEDTLLGFTLSAWHTSVRKRQIQAPKFYFIDAGIVRALSNQLGVFIRPQTSSFGEAFEAFIILEIKKLCGYYKKTWNLSYLLTKDESEIDLIIERPGEKSLCIEIKSTSTLRKEDISSFAKLSADIQNSQSYCLSLDTKSQKIAHVQCLHWQEGLRKIFGLKYE